MTSAMVRPLSTAFRPGLGPHPGCSEGGGGRATSVNLPASVLTQLDSALARGSNPRLAQLTKALRSNREVLDELRRNNPIVENLLGRAMWANLPALEEYDRKGQVPETARLWTSSSFGGVRP